MELGPALWHYREIATGDVGAVLHALAWTGLGDTVDERVHPSLQRPLMAHGKTADGTWLIMP